MALALGVVEGRRRRRETVASETITHRLTKSTPNGARRFHNSKSIREQIKCNFQINIHNT